MRRTTRFRSATAIAIALTVSAAAAASAFVVLDPGQTRDTQLNQGYAPAYFGVECGLAASSTTDLDSAAALADPRALVTLARGLKARVVTAGKAATSLDQMVLWPAAAPKYLIACNEQGATEPGLQRINLATGVATTIVTGTVSCDPVRATSWGTLVFGEEAGSSGGLYEMLDPVAVTGATLDRVTGASSDPRIVRRDALGLLSYEGLAVLPNGVTYYGDELSAGNGLPGGAYYKFVPTTPWTGGAPIASLSRSPLASGAVFGLRVGASSNYGQGFSYGQGSWRPLSGASGQQLRTLAGPAQLTGYTDRRTWTSTPRRCRPAGSGSAATTPAGTTRTTSARRSASPTGR